MGSLSPAISCTLGGYLPSLGTENADARQSWVCCKTSNAEVRGWWCVDPYPDLICWYIGQRNSGAAPDLRDSTRQRLGLTNNQQQQLKLLSPSLAKILYKRTLKSLASLPLAIGELFLLAGLSAVGTIVEQNKPLQFYQEAYPDGAHKVLGFLTYHWIFALQLDHMYTANYFLGLMALLGASLAACTATRQLPMVKVARRYAFHFFSVLRT